MRLRNFNILLVAMAACAAPASAEPGDMVSVKITINVEDIQTSRTVPPRTVDVEICMEKDHDVRVFSAPSKQKASCEIRDYQVSESMVTFQESCDFGSAKKESAAMFEMRPDGFYGTIRTELEIDGQISMITDSSYEGTVTGECDYSPSVE